MTNFFAGIYRANDALTAARYGLEVTGQNIANANTPGYTRQRADQVSVGAAVGVPMISTGPGDNAGVRAVGASRLGDAVLDARMRAEHARSASVDTSAARLADIENIFTEPSDTGLAEQLHDYWNAWGDVANDPGGQVPREMLIASAQSTATMLHSKSAALDDVATAARNSLDAAITSANTDAESLADLNTKIAIGHATGANVNSLLDQRDVLLDNLSKSVGAVATLHENGTVTVTVGGANGTTPRELVSTGTGGVPPYTSHTLSASINDTDPTNVTAAVSVDGVAVTLNDSTSSAEIKALTDTVPNYRKQLNDVARALAKTVNDLQDQGFTVAGAHGDPMFAAGPNSGDSTTISDITAANISVAYGFTYDAVAAAGEGKDSSGAPTGATAGALDAGNALAAAKAGLGSGSPDTAYSSLIGDLGRASASAKQQQATQSVITASVDTLKNTASGVSFDEEVSNLLTYQMAFQASSRVLTTLDSMLDTLINRTGLVGRA